VFFISLYLTALSGCVIIDSPDKRKVEEGNENEMARNPQALSASVAYG
jgi:hypothetical protein